MPSTKPEVRNIWHYHRRRTEPRSEVTCIENLVKFACVVSEIRKHTDKETKRQTYWSQYNTALRGQSNKSIIQWLNTPVFIGEMRAKVLYEILQPLLLQLFANLSENVMCQWVCGTVSVQTQHGTHGQFRMAPASSNCNTPTMEIQVVEV